MHSRIIGLVEKDYYDNHKDEHSWELYYDDEVPHFADYTDSDTDVAEDFMWLVQVLVHDTDSSLMEVDDKELTIKFKPGFKERYFKDKWDALVKKLLGNPDSFDEFCGLKGPFPGFDYDLKKLIDEEYSFYIADEYGGYETLDHFVRSINYDKTYKCFDSVDYHY